MDYFRTIDLSWELAEGWYAVSLTNQKTLYGYLKPYDNFYRLDVPERPLADPQEKIRHIKACNPGYRYNNYAQRLVETLQNTKYLPTPGFTLWINKDHILMVSPKTEEEVKQALGQSEKLYV